MAPLLHRLPLLTDDVSITLPPVQNVVGPFVEIVGAEIFITFIAIGTEVPAHMPEVVTV